MSTRSLPNTIGTNQKNMHTNETPEMRLQTHSLGISPPKTEKAEISFTSNWVRTTNNFRKLGLCSKHLTTKN